jgi:ABC-type Fe3+/spermidine/putrescine transport system ATPase subunit
MRKIKSKEQKERIHEALRIVGLEKFGGRKPSQLSGGEQQRVALARAVVTRPDILLFDEPLSNLDAKLRDRVRVEIRQLQKKLGITSVYVTHDQAEALAISDRILVINGGIVQQEDEPFNLYRKPKNSFVADFIGAANIGRGRITGDGGSCFAVETGYGVFSMEKNAASLGRKIGDTVSFAWRPEDAELNFPDRANRIEGVIEQAIFMGGMTDVFFNAGGTKLRAQVAGKMRLREGEQFAVRIDAPNFCLLGGV